MLGQDYTLSDAEKTLQAGPGHVLLHYQGEFVRIPDGPLPVNSVAAAVVAIRRLEPGMAKEVMEQALGGLRVPGRFEQLGCDPAVFVDVGHNPHAAAWLAGRLARLKQAGARVHAVYGALADKDVEGVASALSDVADAWYLGGLAVPRGLSAQALQDRLSAVALPTVAAFSTVTAALDAAISSADPDDLVIAFGSFYTVADVRDYLAATSVPPASMPS
jgi:dihydrofolate synthase/folylpolyglutamate synthase